MIAAVVTMLRRVPLCAWMVAVVLAWGAWQRHAYTQAAQAVAEEQRNTAQAREAALLAAIRAEQQAMQEAENVATTARKRAADARRDADRARVAADGLRAAADAAGAVCSDPASVAAATGRGDGAEPAGVVLAELLGRAAARAVELARTADDSHGAAVACERLYTAVSGARRSSAAMPPDANASVP